MIHLTTRSSSHHTVHDDNIEDSQHPNDTMILLNKFKVDPDYFDIVESNFHEIRPFLLPEIGYTAEELVGSLLWADLTGLAQRQAHLCLRHMATLPDSCLIDMSGEEHRNTDFQIIGK